MKPSEGERTSNELFMGRLGYPMMFVIENGILVGIDSRLPAALKYLL